MRNRDEFFPQVSMQFIQSKLFIKLLILVPALGLLLVPVVASIKAFSKNSERENNLVDMQKNPEAPEIIQKTEEIEEIEYVYLKTAEPTQIPAVAPIITQQTSQSPTVTPRSQRRIRDEEDDD